MASRWINSAALALAILVGGQAWVQAQDFSYSSPNTGKLDLWADELETANNATDLTLTGNVKISATLPVREKGQAPTTLQGTSGKMTFSQAKSGITAVMPTVKGVAPRVTVADAEKGVSVLTGTTITISQPKNADTFTIVVDGNVKFTSKGASDAVITCQYLEGKIAAKGKMQTMNARGNIMVSAERTRTDGINEKLHATAPLMNYFWEGENAFALLKSQSGVKPKIVVTRIDKDDIGKPVEPDVFEITSPWIRYNLSTGDFSMRPSETTAGGGGAR